MSSEPIAPPRSDAPTEPLFEPLVVHRSTIRTWLISLAAIPAVVVGVDVLWRQRIIGWVSDFVFESDPQTLETRDTIWAWTLVVVGGIVLVWGLKELFFPAPVVLTDDDGVHVRLRGPFQRMTLLPWFALYDIDAGTLEDDEEDVEVLIVEVKEPELLPDNPWSGRRIGDRTVALFSTEWDTRADEVAVTIANQAMTVARHRPPQ